MKPALTLLTARLLAPRPRSAPLTRRQSSPTSSSLRWTISMIGSAASASTHLDRPENYAISTQKWRYIHYFDGGEELYDSGGDPYEWTNLGTRSEHAAKLAEMRTLAPREAAPLLLPNEKMKTPRRRSRVCFSKRD